MLPVAITTEGVLLLVGICVIPPVLIILVLVMFSVLTLLLVVFLRNLVKGLMTVGQRVVHFDLGWQGGRLLPNKRAACFRRLLGRRVLVVHVLLVFVVWTTSL